MASSRYRIRALSASVLATTSVIALASCSALAAGEAGASSQGESGTASALWDSSSVHEISIDFDQDAYDAMIQAYLDTEEKQWIEATVEIDGVTYERVGLKLKGNSSLRALSEESAESPEDLPWLIRLDKYVDGQNDDGTTELVVRGNSSQTGLNEALALDLLEQAGLASEQAIAVRFSAADSEEALRLVVENPDDGWMQAELGDGLLYKAEAGGDYSYRGADPASYVDVFEQEGGEEDYTPLIGFLQWVNESTDEEFAAQLGEHLDVQSFATYLAFQELVENSDDIDGPGNNSYLYYDPDSALFTVVNWDLNLAFGATPGGGGGGGGGGGAAAGGGVDGGGQQPQTDAGAQRPDVGAMPPGDGIQSGDGMQSGDATQPGGGGPGGGGRGGMGGSNVLSERFLAVAEFAALVDSELDRLQSELIDSGVATELLDSWTQTLVDGASDLVAADTIAQESDALAAKLAE
ncbi:MAG: CotH kinase family protein [Microbacterium sp.]